MLKKAPIASAIRTANRNAVGGGPKRCRKGKNCSATCIDAGKDCLVGLPEPVSVATGKVVKMLQERQGQGGGGVPAATPAPVQTASILKELSSLLDQATEELEDAYGTEEIAAATAKFRQAKANYEKALAAASANKPIPDSLSGGVKQADKPVEQPKKTKEQVPDQDDLLKKAAGMKLSSMKNKMEELRGEWSSTIGKGDPKLTKMLGERFQTAKKEYEDYKAFVEREYTKTSKKTPAQLTRETLDHANKEVQGRLDKRLTQGVEFWDPKQRDPVVAARREAQKVFRNLSPDELSSLGLYGENRQKYYLDVNKFLRTGSVEGLPADRQQIVRSIVANLGATLEKLPASSDTNFERAVSGNTARGLRNLKVGDIIEDKGFGSFTTAGKPQTLDQFFRQGENNALMRVTSRNARRVAPAMEFEREDEHIMRPGTKYRVTGIVEDGHRSRKVGSMPTYTFEEISE